MRFYTIKDAYITYLKQYDSKVADNKSGKRPYVGIILEISGMKYYAPFSSPKPKHLHMKNAKDFRKINGGKYGVINFNNMIPVIDSAVILIDIQNITDIKYKRLLQNQYNFIRADQDAIKRTAENLRTLILKKDSELTQMDLKIKQRCCNLPLLESVISNYQAK